MANYSHSNMGLFHSHSKVDFDADDMVASETSLSSEYSGDKSTINRRTRSVNRSTKTNTLSRISHVVKRIFNGNQISEAGIVDDKGYPREVSRSKVLMWFEEDMRLFDSITEWKTRNPNRTKEEAFTLYSVR